MKAEYAAVFCIILFYSVVWALFIAIILASPMELANKILTSLFMISILLFFIYRLIRSIKKPKRKRKPPRRFGRTRLLRRYKTLPEECPICKTPLTPENIHWIDEKRVECLNCGYVMKLRKARKIKE